MSKNILDTAVLFTIIGLTVAVPLAIGPVVHYSTIQEIPSVKITDKERTVKVVKGSSNSKYLVFTENEVFQNADAIFSCPLMSSSGNAGANDLAFPQRNMTPAAGPFMRANPSTDSW